METISDDLWQEIDRNDEKSNGNNVGWWLSLSLCSAIIIAFYQT